MPATVTTPMHEDALPGACKSLPEELYLEVTNRCNLRCATCPQSWGMPEPSADLSPERARELLDQLPSVRRVVLHGIGEPTLNPRLPEIIAVVKARGAYALFNTNGLLLRRPLNQRLVESGLDEVRISVDAATPETYRLVRKADAFGRVIANVRALAEIRARIGGSTPRLSLWMTGLRSTVRELPDLVRLAASAGIAEVYLQRLVYSERNLARAEEAIFGRLDVAERAGLAEAERLALKLGVTLRGSGEALPRVAAPGPLERPWAGCRRPTSLMYITANGNVLPCCIAPFTEAAYSSIVLGNSHLMSLEEIWNGDRYRNWRQRMDSDDPPAACRGCGSAWAL